MTIRDRWRRLMVLAAAITLISGLAACGSVPPSGSAATPSASPALTPGPCPIPEQSGRLTSDRLVDIGIESTPTADNLVFVLGERSSAPTEPTGRLRAATPPFTMAGSGQGVIVPGTQFVEINLQGLLLYDDQGTPTYGGERRLEPGLSSLKAVVNIDESEGFSVWIAGYAGSGCVTLAAGAAPGTFVVSFNH